MNKSLSKIQGTGGLFNNKFQTIVSTFTAESLPSGWTLTYDIIKKKVKYSYYHQDGKEEVWHQGHPLEYVTDITLKDDKTYHGYERTNVRFTGLVCNGLPFIGTLEY